jgi:antibiotic biosynthesis monooxygenase (ABM) superfamily enzyme
MPFSTRIPGTRFAFMRAAALVLSALCLLGGASREAAAQFAQQGSKLVGSGAVNSPFGAQQGTSAALSADGNTLVVGGPGDTGGDGAAWVFTQSGGVWTQQGSKLVGSGNSGPAGQGSSIALSADGNTMIVSGPNDNSGVGAAWVFTRSGGVWTPGGTKLPLGTGAVGNAGQGTSVALSGDGDTAIVGGPFDNSDAGAAWVFTRSAGVWTQQGSKLVGSGATGAALQGTSVALSADGNTAIVGGYADNSNAGAAWVFTRSGGVWTPGGTKLPLGTGAVGAAWQGFSVALSADGNTAIAGGPDDNSNAGAAWVFTQSGGVWTQQGSKLVGSGNSGSSEQGRAVALSADGNTLSVGGPFDNSEAGAAWVFSRSAGVWTQQGSKLVGSGAVGDADQGISVTLSGDGSTAIVGGPFDDSDAGAAWVFVGPTVRSISPASGPAAGGTSVTITGLAFTGATTVAFGSTPALFEVNSDTSITAASPAGGGTVDVTVTNAVGTSATGSADQFTYIPTLTLASTGSSTTQVGQSYSQTNVASGGTTPYTYSVSAGELPAGTTLSASTGTVSGTPTASGAFSYAITATDSGSPAQTATQVVSGTIAPATLTLTATASSTTQVGQAYSQTNVGGGGTTPYTYSLTAGTLPAGTTLNTSAGTVSGTPTTAGAFNYTIKVTDSGSPAQTATQITSGTIAAAMPTVTAVSPNGGPPAGGTSVTITGTNLTGASAVKFGGAAAARFAVNGATSITAIAPAGAAGTVDVTVTTGNGTSATSGADHFTYASPRMTQQGPKLVGSHASGDAEQGISVSLSADGNTAIVGGPADNSGAGAAWIFSRNSPLPAVAGAVGAPVPRVAPAAWTQTGEKLVGTGATGAAQQGYAVALSGDGNTAIVGGYNDNASIGAVWIFTRKGGFLPLAAAASPGIGPALPISPGPWSQQGAKLVAGNEAGAGIFGISVALSFDGNTAIIGGYADSSGTGAAWIFTRSNGVWSEQAKLVGTGAVGNALQGIAVALSGDGNIALVGGYGDNADNGAAWVFVRSGTTWTQVGSKLVGNGNVGAAEQGYAVALSSDGNTALVGGFADNADTGAMWIFTQSGGVWTQVGSKLIGTGAIGAARQGFSAALSADASTAAIAGYEDNTFNGAVWMFTLSGGVWTQFGSKLFGSGAVGPAEQGSALALSANGTTLLEGGAFDNAGAGAAWVFVAPGAGAFTAAPTAGQGPLAVTFSASGLTPPMTYTVNFGDGTTGALGQSSCIAPLAAGGAGSPQCSASASHTYTNAGTDTATLLNASGITLGSTTITVNASNASK